MYRSSVEQAPGPNAKKMLFTGMYLSYALNTRQWVSCRNDNRCLISRTSLEIATHSEDMNLLCTARHGRIRRAFFS